MTNLSLPVPADCSLLPLSSALPRARLLAILALGLVVSVSLAAQPAESARPLAAPGQEEVLDRCQLEAEEIVAETSRDLIRHFRHFNQHLRELQTNFWSATPTVLTSISDDTRARTWLVIGLAGQVPALRPLAWNSASPVALRLLDRLYAHSLQYQADCLAAERVLAGQAMPAIDRMFETLDEIYRPLGPRPAEGDEAIRARLHQELSAGIPDDVSRTAEWAFWQAVWFPAALELARTALECCARLPRTRSDLGVASEDLRTH